MAPFALSFGVGGAAGSGSFIIELNGKSTYILDPDGRFIVSFNELGLDLQTIKTTYHVFLHWDL